MAKIIIIAFALLGVVCLAYGVVIDHQCAEHEYYSQHTPMCPVTCQTRHRIHCLGLRLSPSCQCIPGYLYDSSTSKCVPTAQCPEAASIEEYVDIEQADLDVTDEEVELIRQSCDPATELFSETTPACPSKCFNGHINLAHCMAILNRPSCQCRSGHVRDAISQKCILATQCASHLF